MVDSKPAEAGLTDGLATSDVGDEPDYPLVAGPSDAVLTVTHDGLAEADPWAGLSAGRRGGQSRGGLAALWPWGLKGVAETLEVVGLALLMFVLVRGVAQNFIVDGGSMEPTLHDGEMLIVNKLSYKSFDIAWLPWSDNHQWRPFGDPQDPSAERLRSIVVARQAA